MGYCIDFIGANFTIKAENVAAAQAAVAELWRNMPNDPRCGGGGMGRSWYSWMNNWKDADKQSLPEQIAEWNYETEVDEENGDISGIGGFTGEKIGQEEILWATLAPFVEAGSYIEVRGEDGAQWRWVFDGKAVKEVSAKIVYE